MEASKDIVDLTFSASKPLQAQNDYKGMSRFGVDFCFFASQFRTFTSTINIIMIIIFRNNELIPNTQDPTLWQAWQWRDQRDQKFC